MPEVKDGTFDFRALVVNDKLRQRARLPKKGSYNHLNPYIQEFNEDGKPKRTSPKLTPDSFDSLPDGLGDKLKRRSMASHRRSQIAGWVVHVRDDHRISASANAQGTPTGRMKHRVVANVPKPSKDKKTGQLLYYPDKQPIFFGTEMRDLFRAAPGKVLVGRDAAGIGRVAP